MPKIIQLTRGKETIVDDEDYEWLVSQGKWQVTTAGYAVRQTRINNRKYVSIMHRLIMSSVVGCIPRTTQIDHIDFDPLNNQKYNLRIVNPQQNAWHHRKQSNNTSGYKCVCLIEKTGNWGAYINGYKNQIWIGTFPSKIEAAKAYDAKAIEMFGEYAVTNFKVGNNA